MRQAAAMSLGEAACKQSKSDSSSGVADCVSGTLQYPDNRVDTAQRSEDDLTTKSMESTSTPFLRTTALQSCSLQG